MEIDRYEENINIKNSTYIILTQAVIQGGFVRWQCKENYIRFIANEGPSHRPMTMLFVCYFFHAINHKHQFFQKYVNIQGRTVFSHFLKVRQISFDSLFSFLFLIRLHDASVEFFRIVSALLRTYLKQFPYCIYY